MRFRETVPSELRYIKFATLLLSAAGASGRRIELEAEGLEQHTCRALVLHAGEN